MGRITWAEGAPTTTLASALGVSSDRAVLCERVMHDANSLKSAVDRLDALNLTENEWAAAMFALGYWRGAVERGAR